MRNKLKIIVSLSLTIFIFSCSTENGFEHYSGNRLISIEYKNKDESWIENHTYSSDGVLNRIENFHSLGKEYTLNYKDSRLNVYHTYRKDNGKLIFRDSIVYNENGTIHAIYNFSVNSGENLPLSWIYEYEYDNINRIKKKSTYFVITQEYTSIEKYYWSNGNIKRSEYYNGKGKLDHEFFYEYDDKINYKKEIPTGISDPINWSKNNITKVDRNDYLVGIDILCQPCIAEYKYNLDNLPISIKFNWGLDMKLNYGNDGE